MKLNDGHLRYQQIMVDGRSSIYHRYCFKPVNHKIECCTLAKYLLHKPQICMKTYIKFQGSVCLMCVFLIEASCYHASKGMVIVSHPKAKEQQK